MFLQNKTSLLPYNITSSLPYASTRLPRYAAAGLRGFLWMRYVPLKFVAEMAHGGRYWPSGGLAKRANSVALYLLSYTHNQVDIVHGTVAVLQTVQYFFEPSRCLHDRASIGRSFPWW